MDTQLQTELVGTGLSDQIDGSKNDDTAIGLSGNDTINGHAGDDQIHGDYAEDNLLDGTASATSFSDYAISGAWAVEDLNDGHQQMSQTISTEAGGVYEIGLSLAANFAGGRTDAAIEILVDDVLIGEYSTDSGAFSDHTVSFTAEGPSSDVIIRSISKNDDGPMIDTSGPIYHYDKTVEIGGEEVTVAAFADGQSNLYQVLNGTLHVFDVETQTYEVAGEQGTVNVNSMGYNQEDDLLYAIAVGNGSDSLGNPVQKSDLVMIDANGASYLIGETSYRSWTGDFDDQGNLWSFQASMNHISVIDVDSIDENGNPEETIYKLSKDLVDVNVYDVAFDAEKQAFFGVARPPSEGEDTVLLVIDISDGEPDFSTIPVTSTVVDGETLDGVPAMTFGAAIIDADGNLFVGGNSGDHDMDDATQSSGAIYQVVMDEETGEASLHLIEEAPKSYSNDGAADPTAQSPFEDIDIESSVLIRDLSLVATTEGELTYDDDIKGGAGHDTLEGGIGADTVTGNSEGDALYGESGNDNLHGGAGDDGGSNIISTYDEDGVRYDQHGNVLTEDDDFLSGGDGDDTLSGSAGHDTLEGGQGDDNLRGGSGNDILSAGEGNDDLLGGSEADILRGGSGQDTLDGGSGDDTLSGEDGQDTLLGGSGHDHLNGGGDADNLSGGSGDDVLQGGDGQDVLDGGSGNDTLDGQAGDDVLDGKSGDDTLFGGNGDNTLKGSTGDDFLVGGGGNDALNGGSDNDTLHGAGGKDYLNGSNGNDVLDGGAGNDRIVLGSGNDTAEGGAGADKFIFRSEDLDGSTDVIRDYSVSDGDKIDLRSLEIGQDGEDAEAWFSQNVSEDDDDVFVELDEDTHLILEDAGSEYDEDVNGFFSSFLF